MTTLRPCPQSFSVSTLPMPLDEPVTSAHSHLYLSLRFCGFQTKASTRKGTRKVSSERPPKTARPAAIILSSVSRSYAKWFVGPRTFPNLQPAGPPGDAAGGSLGARFHAGWPT